MLELLPDFPTFLLIFVRVTAFFLLLPIFSYRTIPTTFRLGLGFFLAFVMFYTIDAPIFEINGAYFLLVIKEVLIGLMIGFFAYMILSAIQIAGGFIDFQMGFAIANVIDPQTGAQSPITGQYFYIITILFLLSVNGHHLLLDGIYYSYEFIPIDHFIPFTETSIADFIIKSFSTMFMIALQMAIPVVGSLFLVDVALGIVARTVPQLNVFVVGLPLKILVSFVVMMLYFVILMTVISRLFEYTLVMMRNLMELIGGF